MERRDYLQGGLCGLQCSSCGAKVLVKKNSVEHTTVQWTVAAARECSELGGAEPGAVVRGCGRLRDTINHAVLEGLLEVGDG